MPTAFTYNLDLTTLALYSSSCPTSYPFNPHTCDAVIDDASNAHIHYSGWATSNDSSWSRSISMLALVGAASGIFNTLQIDFDASFTPDDTLDLTNSVGAGVEANGRTSGAVGTIHLVGGASVEMLDEAVHHVTLTAIPLPGFEEVAASHLDLFVNLGCHGGHAVGGSGQIVRISNVVISGTWHPAGPVYTPIHVTPTTAALEPGDTQTFTTNKPGDWMLSSAPGPDPDGAAHDGTTGTLQAPGTISNAAGTLVVSSGKTSALYTAPSTPASYYVTVWDSDDA